MPFKLHRTIKVTRTKTALGNIHSKETHFWFTLTGANNKVILTSETYNDRRNAVRGIRAAMAATLVETSAYIDMTGLVPGYKLLRK